ncbi:hypothetical protein SAMN02745164_00884 [Marinitoga hydrogenitolerans DSM 16785]|uniref:Uncharacterized protein n=1 Tax=Marinitoga hydrogenitolerans (strain DSM 16785 / JCM 12826 / AT1271) TaxID=1122195 RepID=A0A1M4VAB5_MARH1|nr:hypothetical protein [Marinitoga hydrogenitolerans]SHE65889.1 hypothetical protein SAMN02745164_00884 [Marinitoga hydrogenitolerans DSM 16785]
MDLSPNEIINKIVNAEIETNEKLKKAEENLKKELKEKIFDLEKKKNEKFDEINKSYYTIIKNAEISSKKIMDECGKDILKIKEKFDELEKNIDSITLKVLDKIIL